MTQKKTRLALTLSLFTLLLGAITLTSLFVGYKISSHRSSEFSQKKQISYRENRWTLENTLSLKGRTVFIGDSLIAGAPWNEIFPDINVSIRGYDGITTKQITPLIETIGTKNPEKAIIMLGINDVYTNIPAKDTCESLEHIASIMQENSVKTLMILPFPSIKYGKKDLTQGVKEILHCMKDQELGSKITLLDLTKIMTDGNMLRPEYTYDGVHLTSQGYQTLSKHIGEFLKD